MLGVEERKKTSDVEYVRGCSQHGSSRSLPLLCIGQTSTQESPSSRRTIAPSASDMLDTEKAKYHFVALNPSSAALAPVGFSAAPSHLSHSHSQHSPHPSPYTSILVAEVSSEHPAGEEVDLSYSQRHLTG